MLDLQARVHLEEIEPRGVSGPLEQKLHRAGIPISRCACDGNRGVAHALPPAAHKVGVAFNHFANKDRLPVPAEDTWKVFTTFDIPVSKTARIPVSVVYTNDPNALTKSKYVSGQIGISYDFTALTALFRRAK
jgi:hypothetical protein